MSVTAFSHVLLPLYIYPLNASSWQPLFTNINARPDVNFSIVVNPSSGPGDPYTYPNSDYVAGIAKLNSYANANVYGYVDTAFGTANPTTVQKQVKTYKQWRNYTAADIHMDGIFFDEVGGWDASQGANTAAAANYSYYSSIYSYTKKTMGPGFQHVVLNPGAGIDPKFFNIADEIIIFESYYSDYNDNSTPFSVPSQYWNQSTILIHHFNGTGDRQQQIIDNLVGNDFKGVYISTTGDHFPNGTQENSGVYEYFSSLWDRFCNDMYSN